MGWLGWAMMNFIEQLLDCADRIHQDNVRIMVHFEIYFFVLQYIESAAKIDHFSRQEEVR